MAESPPSQKAFRYPAMAFGVLAGLVVLLSLRGGHTSTPWAYQAGGTYIPMAPQTGLATLLLALALTFTGWTGPNRLRQWFGVGCASLAAIMNLICIAGRLGGPGASLGRLPLQALLDYSRVSPLTVLAQSGALVTLALAAGQGWRRRQGAAITAMLPLGIGGVVMLSYLAGTPFLYGTLAVPMSVGAALSSLLLGLGLLLRCGADTWPMALFLRQTSEVRLRETHWLLRNPIALFGVLALLILGGGSQYRHQQLTQARAIAQSELATIADQKVERIADWYRDKVLEARQLFRGALLQNQFQRFLAGSPKAPPAPDLLAWMQDLKRTGYSEVVLFDARGTCRLATGPLQVPSEDLQGVQAALRAKEIRVVDLHNGPPQAGAQIRLWIPIGADPRSQIPPLGVLLLRVDAEDFLFPLLRSWPTLSRSAETVLVRREGDQVVYLNPQRHSSALPLERRLTIGEHAAMPSIRAATGATGFAMGDDYRGVPVVAAMRQVPGTAWSMVAKMDQDEIFAPMGVRNRWTVAVMLALVLVLALGMGVVVRNLDNHRILGQLALEREQSALAERFQQVMQQANDIILLMTPDGRLLETNGRAQEAYGFAKAELEQMNIRELRAPQAQANLASDLEQAIHGDLPRIETFHLRRDGSTFPVEVSSRAVVFAGETFLLSFVRDSTERHRQAKALQRLSQLYAALSQVNQAIVWSAGLEELFAKICQVLVDFGHFKMAWIGRHDEPTHTVVPLCHAGSTQTYFLDLQVRTDDSALGRGPVGTAIRDNRPCLVTHFLEDETTLPWRDKAMEAGFAAAAAFPVRLDGKPLYCLAVFAAESDFFGQEEMALLEEAARDLSFALGHLAQEERRTQAEEALRQSEARLKTLTEGAPDFILTLDSQGHIRYLNRPLPGQPIGQVMGQPWLEWLAQDYRGLAREAWKAALATGESQEIETPALGLNGESRWYRVRISPIIGAGSGPAVVVFATDIHEARKAAAEQADLEAQLIQSQKLESLGSLAGGVAHDMNNVLGAILSLASAHREQLKPGEAFAASLDTIINACLRGRGVVKSLLYFAHKDLEQVSAIDVNALVKEMVQLLAYTTLKRIHLDMALQEHLGTLHGDSGALSHTLMNLCVNAMDAMPGGGSLTISTDRLQDGRLQVRVLDTGCGMTQEVRDKAMEPFFTTKPQGKGTGLGLSMAYATMKAHDGTLELRSAPGQGTQVILTFPASRMSGTPSAASAPPAQTVASSGPWRILLVDDDELIRASVAPMLEILGHQVAMAPGGLEALAQLEEGLEVDLVILDMNMPGLNGAGTLPRLLELRPGQPVLMATGYTDEDIAALLEGRPSVYSIRKPFSLNEIRAKFQEILG